MTTIKRTVRVTIEKEIEIELMPSMFGGMSVDEYLAEFRKGLWHVETIDDVVKYAATLAANDCRGIEWDGIGLLCDSDHPRQPDVKFNVVSENTEAEVTA